MLGIAGSILLIKTFKSPKYEWYFKEMNINKLNKSETNSKITIAYLDTGISKKLIESYNNRIVSPYNVVDHSSNVIDTHGHGTKIVSVVAGTYEKIGIHGINEDSYIMPIKIISKDGSILPEHLSEAIYYAVDNGADIINISMGSTLENEMVTEAVNYALENEVFVLSAIGDKKATNILYPASLKGVLAIQAQSKTGNIFYLSNTGDKIDFLIPGEQIKSLALDGSFLPSEGSSIATGIMSGVVSLLYSKNKSFYKLNKYLSNYEYKGIIDVNKLYVNF